MKIKIEVAGGLDLCFGGIKKFEVDISKEGSINFSDLISEIKKNYIKDKPEFFIQGDGLRPGILVLINDVDWELEGKEEAEIKEGDVIGFISTLHGG